MNKLFISDRGFAHEVPRTRAKGYKRIVIDDDVDVATPFQFETRGSDLVIAKADESDGGECYTMLCQEFGLVGGSKGFNSKLSVIFCDNGWMLVTLQNGALVMNLDDQLLMPTVGDDVQAPKVVKDDILWVDAEKLLAYSKYLGDMGNWMYDHEFVLVLGGDNLKGMGSFVFRNLPDETHDISLGYIAQYEQQQIKRAEALKAKNMMKAVWGGYNPQTKMEFDEPDPEEVAEQEEEDDSGVDW